MSEKHITVRVEPEAEINSVEKVSDDILKIRTKRSAEDGAANQATIELVRSFLGVSGPIRIVSGHKQTNKILAIST